MAANPLFMMLLMFAVFYFIVIRPKVKEQRAHEALLAALEKGDMVITRGGLIGKVSGLGDRVLTIELADKVRVRCVRSFIEGKYQPEQDTNKVEAKKAA